MATIQDRVSPIDVDLGGEGTYGLCLVARSASGLGDQPPAPGDPPQSWVEVDSTPPAVQLLTPQVGTGVNSGKVAIAWRASDLHLPPKSVSLSWRADQPGAHWQTIADGQENSGQFVWTVPPTAPQRFHLKVEATDTVGHRGSAETTDWARSWSTAAGPAAGSSALTPAFARAPVHRPGRCVRQITCISSRHHSAGPSSSLTASRSEISSAAEASSRTRASSSIGTPLTIDHAAWPFETSGKL